ncbi:MAG: flotillin family protein, partial [Myxococcales bacterium]|nr:flotillin family protein [Myxococcales bacterium]
MEIALALVGLFVFAGVVAALVVKRLLVVCQPHEILVLVGAKRQVGGHVVGYRLIRGGRTMRTPFIERVERLDLSEIPVEFRVTRAYSKGNIPLAVDAVARVKIDGR